MFTTVARSESCDYIYCRVANWCHKNLRDTICLHLG
jgi:hypothetical protein